MDEPDFSKLPYIQQLRGALAVLMNHADNGVIHGGSVPEFLMHQLKVVPHRARIISEDLKELGLRRTDRDGKRHTHYILSPPSGDITAEDVARLALLKEQKKNVKATGKSAVKPKARAKDAVEIDSGDLSDIDTLLKAIKLLEEGAEKTREHIETLNADVKSNSDRADKAEARVKELEGLNAELNRQLEELKQSRTASDPRVQAIRQKYLV